MILGDLFEGRMKDLITAQQDLETAYQSWLHSRGRNAMSDQEFQQEFGLNRRNWAIRNRDYIVARQSVPTSPDDHLYPERQGYRPVSQTNKPYMAEDSERYVLYFNGKAVAHYASEQEAYRQGRQIASKMPDTKIEVKKETCTLTPVQLEENLKKWFKEKWVRFGPDGKIRGACARGSSKEGKPKCLPQAKAHALGKKKRAAAAAKKRREDPNPERRGAAKNVATKVREQGVAEGSAVYYHVVDNNKKSVKAFMDSASAVKFLNARRLKDPTAHKWKIVTKKNAVIGEQGVAETFLRPENAREQQAQLLARTYAELYWGDRSITERARTAREIFRALESGELDMATLKMEIRALEQEHDLDETVDQERQAERNARIIAGEIEDAAEQGNDALVKQKIRELIRSGYNLDKDGNLQRMGMYEQDFEEGIFGFSEEQLQEKQDACYHKVKSRYKVWPSAYASGALVQCRKKGAANWGTGGKKKK